jgi:RNA polymerase II C-terminal domain phosphatase-like 1/2
LRKYLPAASLFAIQEPGSSYFVNIRPGWDDLKNYLITTSGCRRYKVYVCTMAGRYYALETWRLLDPEGSLISSEEISQRIVCVTPGNI